MSHDTDPDRPYVLVSADTHAGASLPDYKPYLATKWHDDFEAWAATFTDGWSRFDDEDPERRFGASSFMSSVNWDSTQRLADLEGEGIAAEVIFPNTVPPFFPAGVISAAGPRTPQEYEYRMAGVQAHNRWLVDFCGLSPGRRAGIAQVLVFDIEASVAEVKHASENGLKGILLPAQHFDGLIHWYLPKYDALWSICEELNMPVHTHLIQPSDPATLESGVSSPAVGLYEAFSLGRRPLAHFLLGGIFERFPRLKYVMTENMASWIPETLAELDKFCEAAMTPGDVAWTFAHEAVERLTRKPSEYFGTNCYAATFLAEPDVEARKLLGSDHIMWGGDYPHHEGTFPYTTEALRINFSGVARSEVRQITSLNAIDVYDLDGDALQLVADRIGPRPSEIERPLAPDEWPTDDSPCPTFSARPFG